MNTLTVFFGIVTLLGLSSGDVINSIIKFSFISREYTSGSQRNIRCSAVVLTQNETLMVKDCVTTQKVVGEVGELAVIHKDNGDSGAAANLTVLKDGLCTGKFYVYSHALYDLVKMSDHTKQNSSTRYSYQFFSGALWNPIFCDGSIVGFVVSDKEFVLFNQSDVDAINNITVGKPMPAKPTKTLWNIGMETLFGQKRKAVEVGANATFSIDFEPEEVDYDEDNDEVVAENKEYQFFCYKRSESDLNRLFQLDITIDAQTTHTNLVQDDEDKYLVTYSDNKIQIIITSVSLDDTGYYFCGYKGKMAEMMEMFQDTFQVDVETKDLTYDLPEEYDYSDFSFGLDPIIPPIITTTEETVASTTLVPTTTITTPVVNTTLVGNSTITTTTSEKTSERVTLSNNTMVESNSSLNISGVAAKQIGEEDQNENNAVPTLILCVVGICMISLFVFMVGLFVGRLGERRRTKKHSDLRLRPIGPSDWQSPWHPSALETPEMGFLIDGRGV